MKTSKLSAGLYPKISVALLALFLYSQSANAQSWYNAYWQYRMPVEITNPGSGLASFQIQVLLDTDFPWSHIASDGSDIRFTEADGQTELPYWIEQWSHGTSASLWVRVNTIAATPLATTIYLYYGNDEAAPAANGFNTFEFFDDFSSGTIDPARWTSSGGTWSVITSTQANGSAGLVAQGYIGSLGKHLLQSSFTGTDYVVEVSGQHVTGRVWGLGVRATTNQSTYTLNLYEDLDALDNLYYYAWLGGPTTTTVYRGPVGAITVNTWNRLKVKAYGNTFEIYFNDVLRSTSSSSQWASGSVGLFLEYDDQHSTVGTALYDDIRVRKYAADEPSSVTGIEEANPLTLLDIAYTITGVTCNGGSDGAIVITVSEGTPPLSYLWSNGQTTRDLSGIGAGIYSVHVEDSEGRIGDLSVTVTEPAVLSLSYSITVPFDCETGTATIQVNAAGGTAPYTGTGSFVQSAGSTVYTVTDALGCISDLTVPIDPSGSWLDTGWAFRDPIEISNTEGVTLSEFQVEVSLDNSFDFSLANPDGSDARFTSNDGLTLISHWIESWDAVSEEATIWVRVPAIPPSGATIFMYYGNESAPDVSSGEATFEFFDDFSSAVNMTPGYYEFGPASTIMVQDQVWETSAPHSLSVVKAPSGAGYTYYGYYGPQASGWIAMAGSNDLLTWTKFPSPTNPLMSGNGERWPSVYLSEAEGIYYMVHTMNYGGPSYLVYRTSTDGLAWSEPVTIIQDGYNNQNPSLFHDPNDGQYYLYWYRGESGWKIMSRSSSTVAGLVSATNTELISSSTTLAAPQMLYYDETYFLSTEIYNGEWQVRIYSGTSPTGPFTVLPGNPVLTGGCACLFQHLFNDSIYEYYCKQTNGTWTLDMRVVDPSTGRIMYEQGELDPAKWTADGGTWTVTNALQQDGTSGSVAQGITTANSVLQSSFTGTDYIIEGYGRQLAGRLWGLGVRTQNRQNLYSFNLYEALDNDPRHNLHFYTWANGVVTQDVYADLGIIDLNTWYKLSVKAHGGLFDLYFNDTFQGTASDNTFSSGGVALYGESGTDAQFNDIRVRKYAASDPVATFGTEAGITGQWTGSISSDWHDPMNWRTGLPGNCSVVTITGKGLNDPVITGPGLSSCYALNVADDASLAIADDGELMINGDLTASGPVTIRSTLASSGSLIVSGNSTGNITYNRQLKVGSDEGSDWHLAAPPVATNSDANTGKVNTVFEWSETAGTWTSTGITSTLPGHGYNIRQEEASDGTISFTGPIVNSDLTVEASSPYSDAIEPDDSYFDRTYVAGRSLENPGGKGWNLLGNPYPSAINASAFIGANYSATPELSQFDPNYVALYLFDGTSRRYYYVANSTGWPSGTDLSATHIQAGQGFFVLAMNDNSEFTFTRAMQEHNTGTAMLKSSGETDDRWPGLQLKATHATGEVLTTVVYNGAMTTGVDPGYDVGLFKSGQDIELYTTLAVNDNGVNYTRQALPVSGADTLVIPVGVDFKDGGEVTFSAETVPVDGRRFWLEDRVAESFTDLSLKSYTVTLPADSYGTGRFFIIASTNTPTDINRPEAPEGDLRIWISGDRLVIQGEIGDGSLCGLFDLQGRKLLEQQLTDDGMNIVELPVGLHGVLLVRVTDGPMVITRKLVIP